MSNYLGFLPPLETENLTVGVPPAQYSFPATDGAAGDVLQSQGNGSLVFSAGGGGSGDHTQLINIGVTTHADLDRFKDLISARVNQDVRALASPSFASLSSDTYSNAAGFRVIDKPIADVTHIHSGADPITYSGYSVRCAVGSTRINHGSDNTESYLECKQEEQLFKVAGFDKMNVTTAGVSFNPNSASSYTMPETRGGNGQALVSDGAGAVNWASAVGSTETMAQSFAAATSQNDNVIITQPNSARATLFIVQGQGASTDVFETLNNTGQTTLLVDEDGIRARSITLGPVNLAGSYTLPAVRAVSANQHIVSTGTDGVTVWQGRSFANIYWKDSSVVTLLPTQDQYEQMRGDRQGTFASDFTLSATPFQQNLIYTGARSKFFQVTQCVAWQSENKSEDYTQAIFKGGVLIPGSEMTSELDSNNDFPRNATTIVIVELGTNDSIAGYVKCITDDTDAIIIDYQLTITEV
tara:strand:+ start:2472 stop:3878 length:1407 start_codon:yes stop_codon:yes gene_type:complete